MEVKGSVLAQNFKPIKQVWIFYSWPQILGKNATCNCMLRRRNKKTYKQRITEIYKPKKCIPIPYRHYKFPSKPSSSYPFGSVTLMITKDWSPINIAEPQCYSVTEIDNCQMLTDKQLSIICII